MMNLKVGKQYLVGIFPDCSRSTLIRIQFDAAGNREFVFRNDEYNTSDVVLNERYEFIRFENSGE